MSDPARRRTALITGASRGIGRAVAQHLAGQGVALTLVARSGDDLAAVAAEMRSTEVQCVVADAAQSGSMRTAVDAHVGRYGALDIVVANAGVGRNGKVHRVTTELLHDLGSVNVSAPFELAAAALPHLRRTSDQRPGWFIVVASIAGIYPLPRFAAYSATKAAAVSLARSIAIEEADNGVRACAICPGFVDTDMASWVDDGIAMLDVSDVVATVDYLIGLSPAASVTEVILRRAGAAIGSA